MKIKTKSFFIIILLLMVNSIFANENRVVAIGDMKITIEDIDRQVNLFQIAGNNAWLKSNDTSNSWTDFTLFNNTESGDIKRHWDAQKTSFTFFGFRGQKHINQKQIFYGEIYYNWDHRYKVNQAIEKNPYAPDPFVLADSTAGTFNYLGPQIFVAYAYQITPSFSAGLSIRYNINKGLKTIYTMPEIIDRDTELSLDLAYSITPNITAGFSYKPYQKQEITSLVKQPDGKDPQTYRYRGEFVFRKNTGSFERRAIFEGYQLIPQLAFKSDYYDGVILFNYIYNWHELYDNPSKRYYDGFYQGKQYIINSVFRFYTNSNHNNIFALEYKFNNLQDWARNPNAELLIHQAEYNQHTFVAGYSHLFSELPLLAAIETSFYYDATTKDDYLAQIFRNGINRNFKTNLGFEYSMKNNLALRGGIIYNQYDEDPIWNYFGSYSGLYMTFGVGYIYKKTVMDLYGFIGKSANNSIFDETNIRTSKKLNFSFEIKQYF